MNKFTDKFLNTVGIPTDTISLLRECWDETPFYSNLQLPIGEIVSAICVKWYDDVEESKRAMNVILDTLPKVALIRDIKVSINEPPHPWAIFAFDIDNDSLHVATTVGLTKIIQAELIMVHALPMTTICTILNTMGTRSLPSRVDFNVVDNILPGMDTKAKLIEVPAIAVKSYVDIHDFMYKGETKKYYQVVLSDVYGIFPDEAGYSGAYKQVVIQ